MRSRARVMRDERMGKRGHVCIWGMWAERERRWSVFGQSIGEDWGWIMYVHEDGFLERCDEPR